MLLALTLTLGAHVAPHSPPCATRLESALRHVDAIVALPARVDAAAFQRLNGARFAPADARAAYDTLVAAVTSPACVRASRDAPPSWFHLASVAADLARLTALGAVATDAISSAPVGPMPARRRCERVSNLDPTPIRRPDSISIVEWNVMREVDRGVEPRLNAVIGRLNEALCAEAEIVDSARITTWLHDYSETRAAVRADLARDPRLVVNSTVAAGDRFGLTVLGRVTTTTWRAERAVVIGAGAARGSRDGLNRGEIMAGVIHRRALITGGVVVGDERATTLTTQVDTVLLNPASDRPVFQRTVTQVPIATTRRRAGAVVTAAWLSPRFPTLGLRYSSIDGLGAMLGVGF